MSETVTIRATPTLTTLQALLLGHAALQILDLASTAWALGNGGYEANPIARALIAQSWWAFGAVKFAMAAAFLSIWPALSWMRPAEGRLVVAAMGAFAVFMTFVVVNNALLAL